VSRNFVLRLAQQVAISLAGVCCFGSGFSGFGFGFIIRCRQFGKGRDADRRQDPSNECFVHIGSPVQRN
jgi:hypothetical protein